MHENFERLIGKKVCDLERELGLTQYVELKDFFTTRERTNHAETVAALMEFIDGTETTVVRLRDGVVEEFIAMENEAIRENALLLGSDGGRFYDDDIECSYAVLGSEFFSYVLKDMLMFSGTEQSAARIAHILDDHHLARFGPSPIEKFSTGGMPVGIPKKRKIGRNDHCHCGSGEKYKRCCLEKDAGW